MLKYTDTKIVFREVPDEITLAINISGCPCACEGCHSSYLAEDIGEELSEGALSAMIYKHESISCISFMGGDGEPSEVSRLAAFVKSTAPDIAVAWYSGRDVISQDINLHNFEYVKVGGYNSELGGLDSETTNQRLYKVTQSCELIDITYRMRR